MIIRKDESEQGETDEKQEVKVSKQADKKYNKGSDEIDHMEMDESEKGETEEKQFNSMFISLPHLWDEIPSDLHDVSNLSSFKVGC